jgi:hypothetical protein
MIHFNTMTATVPIRRADWCRALGLTSAQFEILTIKNPPIDQATKTIFHLFYLIQERKLHEINLSTWIQRHETNYNFAGIDERNTRSIHIVANLECAMCNEPLENLQKSYCSAKCRQKAYRIRRKAEAELQAKDGDAFFSS